MVQRLNSIAINRLREYPDMKVSIRPPHPLDFKGKWHTIHWDSTSRTISWKSVKLEHMDWILIPLHEFSGLDFAIEPTLGIATDPSKQVWRFSL